jgi:hypothetical protein
MKRKHGIKEEKTKNVKKAVQERLKADKRR